MGGDELLPPVVDEVQSPTNQRTVVFTGTKQSGTALLLDGDVVLPVGDETTFSISVDLIEGGNNFRFSCRDDIGLESSNVLLTVQADFTPPNPPVLNPEPPAFSVEVNLPLLGTKDFESGVWLNGEQFTPIDDEEAFSSVFDLVQGENVLRFSAKDAAGNESTVVEYRVVHSDVYFTVNEFTSLTATAELIVTGEVGQGVSVHLDGEVLAAAAATDGTWEATLALDEGENVLVFSGEKAGSQPLEITRTVTLDTTPPNAPRLDALPSLTTSASLLLSGEKDVGSSVVVDGIEMVPVSDETSFSGVAVSLSLGLNVLVVTSKDSLENESNPVTSSPSIVYDPSGVQITVDPVDSTVSNSALTLTGTRGSDVDVYIDDELKAAAAASETWSVDVVLDSGLNTLTITGRIGATSSADLVVEVTLLDGIPSAPVVNAPALTSNATPLVVVTKDAGTGLAIGGTEVFAPDSSTEAFLALPTLSEGVQTLVFTAFDEFARVSDETNVTIELDSTGPILDILSPTPGLLVNENLDMLGLASDVNGVVEVRVKIGDDAEVVLGGTTSFDEALSTSNTPNGSIVDVVFTAVDGAGAETSETVAVYIVNGALALSGGDPYDDLSQNADIYVNSDGTFWSVFEDISKEADSDVYLSFFDGARVHHSDDVVLVSDDNDNFATSISPKVADDGTGLVHILFHDDASLTGNSSLIHRVWDGNALTAFGPASVVVDGLTGAVFTSDIDARGGYVAAVYSQNGSIYLSSFSMGGWSIPVLLDDVDAVNPISPRVQVGEDGIAHVVWADTTGLDGTADDPDVVYRRYHLDDLVLSDAILVSVSDFNFVDGNSVAPDIALVPGDPNHLAYISWTETGAIESTGGNVPKIVMRTVDNAAFDAFSVIGNTLHMSDVEGSLQVVNSSIAANALGDVSVAWVDVGSIDSSGSDTDVFVRRFTGVLEDNSLSFSDRDQDAVSTGFSLSPRVGIDEGGNTHVVWTESSDVAGSIANLSDQDVVYFAVAP
ncbi:MAG: hypothetical protein GY822_32320 [Deltaproteobacteria bacterium]|nr:hypothetical protein [Deltaproteobacteria bacterium]